MAGYLRTSRQNFTCLGPRIIKVSQICLFSAHLLEIFLVYLGFIYFSATSVAIVGKVDLRIIPQNRLRFK